VNSSKISPVSIRHKADPPGASKCIPANSSKEKPSYGVQVTVVTLRDHAYHRIHLRFRPRRLAPSEGAKVTLERCHCICRAIAETNAIDFE
jgi:hypothetical protein